METVKGSGPTLRMNGVTGPPASLVSIDRDLNAHQEAKRIKDWRYTDRARGLRTVVLADGREMSGMTHRDAYWFVHALASAHMSQVRAHQAAPQALELSYADLKAIARGDSGD